MQLLNVGCGGQRPQDEYWWNLDNLRTQLKEGTPERTNLDKEPRYCECDLLRQSIPFDDEFFDGVLCQHVLEHFTCHEAVDVLLSCRRVLKPGGLLVASVPYADYFFAVHDRDTRESAVELFGEPISEPEHGTFFSYALWHRDHKQLFTYSSLACTFLRAGFSRDRVVNWDPQVIYYLGPMPPYDHLACDAIKAQLNRRKFSLVMSVTK